MWKRTKGDEGEQELYQSCVVISELSIKQRREKYRFQDFFFYYLGLQHWDATSRHWWSENTIQLKSKSGVWGDPRAHQPCSKAQEEPSPNHSIQGRRCSGNPGGKGRKGWANETNTLQVTHWQRCHLLDSLWKTKFFACSDMIQAHQSKPESTD